MSTSEEESEYTPSLPAALIAIINIVLVFGYLGIVMGLDLSDSVGGYLLICHLIVCVYFAVQSRRPVWWISAAVVAFPLFSLLVES